MIEAPLHANTAGLRTSYITLPLAGTIALPPTTLVMSYGTSSTHVQSRLGYRRLPEGRRVSMAVTVPPKSVQLQPARQWVG